MKRSLLPIALVLSCLAAPAFASGGEKGDWEFGLYTGTVHPDSYNSLDPDKGSSNGFRFGYYLTSKWSLEGSYQTLSTEGDVGGQHPDVDLNAFRANILFNFRAEKKFRWFLTAGLGRESVYSDDANIGERDLGWNWGGGARWLFGKKRYWGLRADARWVDVHVGGPIDATQSNYEVNGGLLWAFGGGPPPDTDGDFVPDKKDSCASTPKGAKVDANGCPKDTDGDKVFDGIDKCADTPRGWVVDATGCPADADADGVADVMDKCPGTPKELKVTSEGCPAEDADGDHVWDGADRCPDTPKGVKVDQVGCPTDVDGDGVWDGADTCPNTPKGTKVDKAGCPMDGDGDGVWDGIDLCPETPKGTKVDQVGCPTDADGDGVWDGNDTCPNTPKGTKVDATGCPAKH